MPFFLALPGGREPPPITCRLTTFPSQPRLARFLEWAIVRAWERHQDLDGVEPQLFSTTISCLRDALTARGYTQDAHESRLREMRDVGVWSLSGLDALLTPTPLLRFMLTGARRDVIEGAQRLHCGAGPGTAANQLANLIFCLGWLAACTEREASDVFPAIGERTMGSR